MNDKPEDEMLDALFRSAREDTRAAPSEAFLARVTALAQKEAADAGQSWQPAQGRRPRRWSLSDYRALFERMVPAGVLAAATCAGLWIGLTANTLMPAELPIARDVIGASVLSDFVATDVFAVEEG